MAGDGGGKRRASGTWGRGRERMSGDQTIDWFKCLRAWRLAGPQPGESGRALVRPVKSSK